MVSTEKFFVGAIGFLAVFAILVNLYALMTMIGKRDGRATLACAFFLLLSGMAFSIIARKHPPVSVIPLYGILLLLSATPIYIFIYRWFNMTPEEVQEKRQREVDTLNNLFQMVGEVETFVHEAKKEQIRRRAELSEPTPVKEPVPEKPTPTTKPRLPHNLRTEHMVIVASPGSGKSQMLQSLILDDLGDNCSIIVIDSQSQLINNLLNVVPANRLVHLAPSDKLYPLALNMFSRDQDSSLYEYIFSSTGESLTPKMATVYRYVSRLVAQIPGGNIETMREILEKGGLGKYRSYLHKVPPIAQAFFQNEFDSRAYDETKQGVLRRLYSLLENDVFAAMFTAPTNKVNIAREIDNKQIILIDTAKRTLNGDAFKIFGRFFISQIAKAVFARSEPYGHRVYLYIDEFQEYAGEEGFIEELLTQARKWNVGVIIAFQFLAQMPDRVLRAIMSNTAIKMVGAVSAADRRAMAGEMGLDHEVLRTLKKGDFVVHYKGQGAYNWPVELGRLENEGTRSRDELDDIRHKMRERYSVLMGVKYGEHPVIGKPEKPEEASEW